MEKSTSPNKRGYAPDLSWYPYIAEVVSYQVLTSGQQRDSSPPTKNTTQASYGFMISYYPRPKARGVTKKGRNKDKETSQSHKHKNRVTKTHHPPGALISQVKSIRHISRRTVRLFSSAFFPCRFVPRLLPPLLLVCRLYVVSLFRCLVWLLIVD